MNAELNECAQWAIISKISEAHTLRQQSEKELDTLLKSALNKIYPKKTKESTKILKDIAFNLDSKRKPVTKSDRKSGEYPYYGASGIVDYVNDYIFDDNLLLISEDGANLVMRTYPIAFSITGKSWVNNHAHVLKFKDQATQKFTEYYLNHIDIKEFVSGMAQPKLNQENLNRIQIPMPELKEQKKIVEYLDSLSEKVQSLKKLQEEQLVDLDSLRASVLHQAFQGGL